MQKIEAAQFEEFFDKRLEMYNSDKALVAEDDKEQQFLVKRLQDLHSHFNTARKGDTATKAREQALQRLENAYYKYKEIISNLDAGRRFYNDLAKLVTKFRDDCKHFTYQRRTEAQHVESDITTGMSAMHLNQAAALQQQRIAELDSTQPSATRPHAQEPLTAPQPTRAAGTAPANVWSEGMPIRFGGGPAHNANPQSQNAPQQRGPSGNWDPSAGLRFS